MQPNHDPRAPAGRLPGLIVPIGALVSLYLALQVGSDAFRLVLTVKGAVMMCCALVLFRQGTPAVITVPARRGRR